MFRALSKLAEPWDYNYHLDKCGNHDAASASRKAVRSAYKENPGPVDDQWKTAIRSTIDVPRTLSSGEVTYSQRPRYDRPVSKEIIDFYRRAEAEGKDGHKELESTLENIMSKPPAKKLPLESYSDYNLKSFYRDKEKALQQIKYLPPVKKPNQSDTDWRAAWLSQIFNCKEGEVIAPSMNYIDDICREVVPGEAVRINIQGGNRWSNCVLLFDHINEMLEKELAKMPILKASKAPKEGLDGVMDDASDLIDSLSDKPSELLKSLEKAFWSRHDLRRLLKDQTDPRGRC